MTENANLKTGVHGASRSPPISRRTSSATMSPKVKGTRLGQDLHSHVTVKASKPPSPQVANEELCCHSDLRDKHASACCRESEDDLSESRAVMHRS